MTGLSSRHGISRWTGEFVNRRQEWRYRRYVRDSAARQLRAALLVAAALFLSFGLSDYALIGIGPAFYILVSLRVIVVVSALALAWAVSRRPARVDNALPVNAVWVVALTVVILIVPLRPETLNTQIPAVMVVVITIYLFIPNRIPFMIAQSVYLGVGFLLAVMIWAPHQERLLATMTLLLVFVNTVGLFTALRLGRLRREQFALLRDERLTNLRLQREVAERQRLQERFERLAREDELTGLCSRRRFFELAAEVLRDRRRGDGDTAVCMIDVDHFKAINDRYGHAAGDAALVAFGSRCANVLREPDIIARLGGEEFVVLLPQTDLDGARDVAERLREAIAGEPVASPAGPLPLTATLGVSLVHPGESDIEPALNRADAALYEGKAAGRDRVVFSDAAGKPGTPFYADR
ncbi:hypothetical protein KBTX_03268 [wastewater metagenome]|uniref:GGDEF domain-containing protein n=2 Tax=unclassified sequences TaxID=12908 RepID=A0A5B8RIP3_9ZZZZ|nr:GGDEF domain-containing protein [Arhodomonas sp. KWT]QEA06925.1 hypothetical protein KBTEX_03268 [uncultured organism]